MVRRHDAVLAAVILSLLLVGCSDDRDEPESGSPTSDTPSTPAASPSASPTSTLPPARQLEDIPDTRTYDARPNADWVVVFGGSAWVANVGKGISRYDADTGEPLGSAGPGSNFCTAMDTGFGSLWAVDCISRRLFRFDLATGKEVTSVQLPFTGIQPEGSLAAGGGGVYAVAEGGTEICRVDPTTNRVADRFPAPEGAAGVRYGFGSLWVTSPTGDVVSRLDPRTGKVQATVEVGSGAYFLDVGEGAVWVLNNSTSDVVRVDPSTDEVAATIDVSDISIQGGDLAVGGGSVWARVSDVLVARIDPARNLIVDRIGDVQGSGSVDADRDAVWISAHDRFAVYRVPIE